MSIENTHLNLIAKHLSQHRAAVLIGAGFSKNAKPIRGAAPMPSWAELHQVFLDKLCFSNEDREKYANQTTPELAQIFELIFKRPELNNVLKETIQDEKYIPSEPHKRLMSLPWSDVLTTNYDTLLEQAAEQNFQKDMGERFQVVRIQDDIVGSGGQNRIIKLHGSFPSNPPYIVTSEDYRTYRDKFGVFCGTVKQCFIENTVCLIGFSGRDPNFRNWMEEILVLVGKEKFHHVYTFLLNDPDTSDETFFREKGIVPIVLGKAFPQTEKSAEKLFIELFSYLSKRINQEGNVGGNAEQVGEKHFSEVFEMPSALKIVESWVSDDRKLYLKRYENGECEQGGQIDIERNEVSVCFPTAFADLDYTFLYDPQNISIEVLDRETTGLRLRLNSDFPTKTIRWLAKGFC